MKRAASWNQDSGVFHYAQSGLLWGLQFLFHRLPSGTAVTVQPGIDSREAKRLTGPQIQGYIHDVGGPTRKFRRPSCEKQKTAGLCKGKKCLAPKPPPQLQVDHGQYLEVLRRLEKAAEGQAGIYPIRHPVRLPNQDKTRSFSRKAQSGIMSAAS